MFKFEQYVNITQENATYTNQQGQKCYQSVHGNAFTRKNKAMEQQTRKTVALYDIMMYITYFLSDWLSPKPNLPTVIKYNISSKCNKRQEAKYEETEIDYEKIKSDYGLEDVKDIVWLKFTTDGYLGVVAVSNDINFQIPTNKNDYDLLENPSREYNKINNHYVYNSSGILVHHIGKKWDKSFVLIIHLPNIPNEYSRHDIEKAIGNYLIEQQVPIIDFYSHLY